MNEEWRDIKGFEGLYQVSNLGNVKRIKHGGCKFGYGYRTLPERMVKQHPDYHGYKKVHLWKNNKDKPLFVHRLVAIAFIENPNNYPQINHKDEDKTNNCVSNLEWCTCKYNNNYGTKKERLREALKRYYKKQ